MYGNSAVKYVLQMGNVKIMAYMHEKFPGIANHEITMHDMPRTVTQAASRPKKQKETDRRCYAAIYYGNSETAQGRVPIRALCDADTVRELLFLVFPKRRMLDLF